jgi:GT2 family glycosyltransferase
VEATIGDERLEFFGGARRRGAAVPVSIIIPSYRIPSILRLCVERVFATTECEVIVCDNGSDAETLEELGRLQAEHSTLRIDRSERNHGFTHAVNRGLRMAAPENHVVILNNDAIVSDGWLDALLDVVEREPDVGIVAPQQILLPGTHTIANHAPYATPHAEIDVNLSAHHRNVIASAPARIDRTTALSFVPFFCVLLTRRARSVVDQLSEEFGPHYRSDSHACFAICTIAGLQILHTPHARVYHLLQRSTRELRATDEAGYRQMLEMNIGTREESARPLWERTSA